MLCCVVLCCVVGITPSRTPQTFVKSLTQRTLPVGKTIEVLALVLGNPASPASLVDNAPAGLGSDGSENPSKSCAKKPKYPCRATLIIVPATLLEQWWEEIQKRTTCGIDREKGQISALKLFKGSSNSHLGE